MSRPDIPRYHRISVKFWDDEKSRRFPQDAQLLALYLLTNKHRHLEGIYCIPLPYVLYDLHWSQKKLATAMTVLTKNEFLSYDPETNVLLIRNALKYQCPESENVVRGAIRRIRDLPQSPLLQEFLVLAQRHCYRQGAPMLAQAFYVELERALKPSLERPSPRASTLLTSNLNQNQNQNHKHNLKPNRNGAEESEASFFSSPRGENRKQMERQECEEFIRKGRENDGLPPEGKCT